MDVQSEGESEGPQPRQGYTGEVDADGLPHGNGHQVFQNGDEFAGVWRHGMVKDGTYTYAGGAKYCGVFSKNLRHGKGTYTWANGQTYSGEWFCGQRSGKGKLKGGNDSYDGAFKENMMHGRGTLKLHNGDVYKGEFCKNVRDGFGEQTFANGDQYRGNWKGGVPNGFGIFTSRDYDRYFFGIFQAGGLAKQLCCGSDGLVHRDNPPCDVDDRGYCRLCGAWFISCPNFVVAQPTWNKPPVAVLHASAQQKQRPSSAITSETVDVAKALLRKVIVGLGMAIANCDDKENESEGDGSVVVRITQVAFGGAAAKAGLARGDYVLRLNGTEIKSKKDVVTSLTGLPPGKQCELVFRRRYSAECETAQIMLGANISMPDYKFLMDVLRGSTAEHMMDEAAVRQRFSSVVVHRKLSAW